MFRHLGAGIFKKLLPCLKSTGSFCLFSKFCKNTQKCLNLGPKTCYLEFSWVESEKQFSYHKSGHFPKRETNIYFRDKKNDVRAFRGQNF